MKLLLNDLQRQHGFFSSVLEKTVAEVLASGWYILGQQVNRFESLFAEYCGVSHCVGVANGTDALELSLRALKVGAGDSVIASANAGMYSTTAILATGAEPLYIEVEETSFCLDPKALESLLANTKKLPKAVIVTHLYGQLAAIEEIVSICLKYNITIIEDCAQSHGAERNGRRAGSFGDLACFSFYPTKNLGAIGDGGAVVTSSAELANRLRLLRQYGWTSKYHVGVTGGRNSRLDELQAAVLAIKLPYLDEWNARRRRIASKYRERISHPQIQLSQTLNSSYVAHLFVIRAPQRESLRQHLERNEIATDIHYPVADHRQACFQGKFDGINLPITERLCQEILTLPCFPEMTDDEVNHVIDTCNRWKA